MTETPVEALRRHEAWALIRREEAASVTLVGGRPKTVERLADVPLEKGPPPPGRRFDRLLAIPFRQVSERGFHVHDDATPLTVIDIDVETEIPVDELLGMIPDEKVGFVDPGGFETSDEEYAKVVGAIIRDEIGNGEAANLVVARNYRARARDWGAGAALSVLRRLLEREHGAYWTFLVFTGDRYLVGASPERHVSVRGGDVRMNPISGTFRLPRSSTSSTGGEASSARGLKEGLLDFLADEKEIFELFMVVDEELKMMCDICHEGGQVLGPFLKPMTHLVHTEYLLAGRTDRDVRDVLRDTMYAATVTGSPVRNACRLIAKYEHGGRGYYGAALALLGRERDGQPTADAPIVIRTADVSPDGVLTVTAGATLVRDSKPASEVAETHAKAAGILGAFGLAQTKAPDGSPPVTELIDDEDVRIALGSRNQRLSRFWLTDQSGQRPVPELAGKSAVIVDGEDDFVNMLRHLLAVLGVDARVVAHDAWTTHDLDADLVVVGPGPGDPRDRAHPKIAALGALTDALLVSGAPFLAVCLGHQVLCDRLGLLLDYKDIVFQGTQSRIELPLPAGAARPSAESVGFYNTFVARVSTGSTNVTGPLPAGVEVTCDPESGDVHLVRGPHYRGIQFHAESILTEHGYDLLRDLLVELLED
ncbi:MAG TPA: anthranilate synthase family protein [Nocardioidaceae bacterium]|nr:anthranilate synthase family protein [Nocardioidaceae bacterium]